MKKIDTTKFALDELAVIANVAHTVGRKDIVRNIARSLTPADRSRVAAAVASDGVSKDDDPISSFMGAVSGAVNAATNFAENSLDDDDLAIEPTPGKPHPAVTNKVIPLHEIHDSMRSGGQLYKTPDQLTQQYAEYHQRSNAESGLSRNDHTGMDSLGITDRAEYMRKVARAEAEAAYNRRFKGRC